MMLAKFGLAVHGTRWRCQAFGECRDKVTKGHFNRIFNYFRDGIYLFKFVWSSSKQN